MPRHNRHVNAKVIAKRKKEGRGRGAGASYKPWDRVQDLASSGRVSRVLGKTTGRQHEIQNKLHLKAFYAFEWSLKIIDIREGFPLPLEQTIEIAEHHGLHHPCNRNKEPIPITTSFLLTVKKGLEVHEEARSVVYANRLKSKTVIDRLEIQRQYWREKKSVWGLITENEIPDELVKNVEWAHPYLYSAAFPSLKQEEAKRVISMLNHLALRGENTIAGIATECDRRLALESGMGLSVIRYLIANRHWLVDMNTLIKPGERLVLLNQLTLQEDVAREVA